MTGSPADGIAPPPPPPVRAARTVSGRIVILLAMLGIPLIAIPLLLTGRGYQRQVCLVTLAQRERSGWQIGYMELGESPWRVVDQWPESAARIGLDGELLRPREASPLTRARDIWQTDDFDGVHYWVTTARGMPFAFVISIDNQRAINPQHGDLLAVQQVAAAVLDSASESDAACARQLAEALLAGQEIAEAEGGRVFSPARRIRNPTPQEGEKLARDLFNPLAEAARTEDPHARMREVLCDAAAHATAP